MSYFPKRSKICAVVAAFAALGAIAEPAFARGGDVSGGGDALICYGPAERHDGVQLKQVYLADTFSLHQGKEDGAGIRTLERLIQASGLVFGAPDVLVNFVRSEDPELGDALKAKLKELDFRFVSSLPELDDDGIPEKNIPWNCRKRQLAIQDISTGVVRVNDSLFQQMSWFEQSLLRLHEAFIALQTPEEILLRNTARIRAKVAELASKREAPVELLSVAWNSRIPAHRAVSEAVKTYLNSSMSFEILGRTRLAQVFGGVTPRGLRPIAGAWPETRNALEFIHQTLLDQGFEPRAESLAITNTNTMTFLQAASDYQGAWIAFLGNMIAFNYAAPAEK